MGMSTVSRVRTSPIRPIRMANILLDGRFGGPQNQVLQVSKRLEKYGIDTLVIIPKRNSDLFHTKLVEKKIKVKRFHLHKMGRHVPQFALWILSFIPEVLSLYTYLKEANFSMVHCTGPWQIKGALAGKMAGTKVIWRLQDTWTPIIVKVLFNALVPLFCDGFIVAGEKTRQYYLNSNNLTSKRIMEIQACVDTSYFDPDITEEDQTIGSTPGIKITTVGNINEYKGLEYFIEIARILSNRHKDLSFYIVGPHYDSQTKYSRKLSHLVSRYGLENVLFYGMTNNVPSVLKATDIYACTSVREASPNAVWEAMAMEKPIVATDVGDVRKFLKDGENGFIVPPRDVQTFAQKLSALIENEPLRNRYGRHARTTAIEELDAEITARKYRDMIFEVLG